MIYELSWKRITVFVTTHYMDEAEYCDRLGLIYRGELIASGAPEALKRDFMPEQVLEIICHNPQEAMGGIEEIESVKEVALYGNGLHVVVQDAEPAILEITKTLREQGQPLYGIEKISPTLEDVFVSLIESRDQAQWPQREGSR